MEQNAQTGRAPRGIITIDWMLLVVGAIALLLLFGTAVRIAGDDDPSRRLNDLFSMHANDDLVAFQDFSFGADDWTPNQTTDRLPGIGPVLGPFADDSVERAFVLPVGTDQVHVMLDLHLLGEWSDDDVLRLWLGEYEVLTLQVPGPDAAEPLQSMVEVDGVQILTQRRIITPQQPEGALPGTVSAFASHAIRMRINQPAEALVLRLRADAGDAARWTLDNLTVVATVGDAR